MAGSPRMTYDGTTLRVTQLTDAELELVARRVREVFVGLSLQSGACLASAFGVLPDPNTSP
jgi:hypothetical protein